jgi:vacuolar-type H+-ATPase subunit B/Vma2
MEREPPKPQSSGEGATPDKSDAQAGAEQEISADQALDIAWKIATRQATEEEEKLARKAVKKHYESRSE